MACAVLVAVAGRVIHLDVVVARWAMGYVGLLVSKRGLHIHILQAINTQVACMLDMWQGTKNTEPRNDLPLIPKHQSMQCALTLRHKVVLQLQEAMDSTYCCLAPHLILPSLVVNVHGSSNRRAGLCDFSTWCCIRDRMRDKEAVQPPQSQVKPFLVLKKGKCLFLRGGTCLSQACRML